MLKVNYNEGLVDQFYHKYEYDEDNRIIAVYTSRDGHLWDKDASYDYYYHGPLQRMEVGEDKVQGIDYLYTIHGWLKGMNHPALDPSLALDPGNDGLDGSGVTGRDAFGMVLTYYEGDYNAPGANGFQSEPSNPYHLAAKEGRNLYNGNISTWASHVLKNPDRPGSMQYEQLTGNEYVYDELNRIRSSHFKVHNTSWGDPAHTDEFHTAYTYDGNGNIASLTRNAYGSNPLMDRLTYYYQGETNKLAYVRDNVPANLWTDDIDNQASTSNYGYDANGNLIRDLSEGIDEIEWTVYGKVSSIAHDDGKTVHYYYDASGNRTMKHVKQGPHDNGKTTYYVRDASGNIMAVYEGEASGDTRTIKLLEQPIYGSDRIGERKETLIVKQVGGSPDNQDLRPREQVPSFRQWSLPLFTEKGTAMAKASTDGDLLEVISIDTPLGAGNATPSGMARDMEGNLQFSLVTAKTFNNAGNVSFVLDRNGDIMPFTYSQRSTAPVKVAPGSTAMTMKASRGAKLHWMFTVGGDGALYRHQIDMALKGNGTPDMPLGEVITTNEHLAIAYDFLSPLMLIEDQYAASPMGYLYLLSQSKTVLGELMLWVYPQGGNRGTTPILLDTFSGGGDGATLFVSPDGKSLAVKVAQGRRLSLLPAHSWGEEIRLYDIGDDYQSLSYYKSVHLPGGKAYNSFAFSPDSKFLYFTDADLAHGYFLKRLDLETDDIVSLRPLYEGYSQVQLAANDKLYVSLSGTDRMVEVEHHATSPALSEISLGLPQGHVLAGALPIHSHMLRAMELGDDVYARVLGNKRYELKDHLGNVRVTLSDRKLSTIVGAKPQNYRPDILTHNNYYPFGMAQTGRYYAGSNDYRYGFNGKEKDDSFGQTSYDYGFRIYNPAIAKFLSVDPLTSSYPSWSPYPFAMNRPIDGIDLDGLEYLNKTVYRFVYDPALQSGDDNLILSTVLDLNTLPGRSRLISNLLRTQGFTAESQVLEPSDVAPQKFKVGNEKTNIKLKSVKLEGGLRLTGLKSNAGIKERKPFTYAPGITRGQQAQGAGASAITLLIDGVKGQMQRRVIEDARLIEAIDGTARDNTIGLLTNALNIGLIPENFQTPEAFTDLANRVISSDYRLGNSNTSADKLAKFLTDNDGLINSGLDPTQDRVVTGLNGESTIVEGVDHPLR